MDFQPLDFGILRSGDPLGEVGDELLAAVGFAAGREARDEDELLGVE